MSEEKSDSCGSFTCTPWGITLIILVGLLLLIPILYLIKSRLLPYCKSRKKPLLDIICFCRKRTKNKIVPIITIVPDTSNVEGNQTESKFITAENLLETHGNLTEKIACSPDQSEQRDYSFNTQDQSTTIGEKPRDDEKERSNMILKELLVTNQMILSKARRDSVIVDGEPLQFEKQNIYEYESTIEHDPPEQHAVEENTEVEERPEEEEEKENTAQQEELVPRESASYSEFRTEPFEVDHAMLYGTQSPQETVRVVSELTTSSIPNVEDFGRDLQSRKTSIAHSRK